MGASRKLQGEIDRVLKKVQEGVDVFDSIWNKVYDTDNVNQKEKFEADLKKEIKKLQRYRDQIKTWIQSSEIKDKKISASYEQSLVDARKQIEREMERFKICEKETKTKAFSKEGLGQQPKTDPKEKAKAETRDWINNVVGELETQIDIFEAEIEGLSVKKGKNKPPRMVHLETSISRHKAHIMKLELLLRLLENEELSPEQVNDVKDFLDDYVERNQDDFDEFGDVDELYSSLPLDKVESLEELVTIGPPGLLKGTPLKTSTAPAAPPAPMATGASAHHQTPVQEEVEETSSQEPNSDTITGTPPAKSSAIGSAASTPVGGHTTSILTNLPTLSTNSASATSPSGPNATSVRAAFENVVVANSSSNTSLSSIAKEDENVNLPSRRPSPSLADAGTARGMGRGALPSQSSANTPLPPVSGLASSGSIGLVPSAAEITKRNILVLDDRLGSGATSPSLVSPLSNRMILNQSAKSIDGTGLVDSVTASENNASLSGRAFPPGVSGIQWRPGSSFNQTETGQLRGRTEIAPDQREKFLQRLQQVQQGGHSTLLGMSSLTGGSQKQFSAQQQNTFQQFGAQTPTSLGLGLQSPGLGSVSAGHLQQSIHQQMLLAAGQKNSESIQEKVEEQLEQQGLPDDSAVESASLSGLGKNSMNEGDLKSPNRLDSPGGVSGGSIAELEPTQMPRDIELSPGQPFQSFQPSGSIGVIGRRIVPDLGTAGDNISTPTVPAGPTHDQLYNLQMLEAAYHKLPQPKDSERARSYCYNPTLKRYFVSSDVIFMESIPFFHSEPRVSNIPPPIMTILTYPETHVESSSLEHDGSPTDNAPPPPPITQVYTRREKTLPVNTNSVQTLQDLETRASSEPSPSAPETTHQPFTTLPPSPPSDIDLPIAKRKGSRNCPSTRYPVDNFCSYSSLSSNHRAFKANLDSYSVPRNVAEALRSPGWFRAMQEEMSALWNNHTWDLCPLPPGKKAVGCKWVFTVKVNPDGSLHRLKARLVAKGYSQEYGIDYDETFSPVAKMASVRICLSLAAIRNWPLHQLDVKNAFLNGILEEEVYMTQPPGFVVQEESSKVCRLRKSLYGLKQSPRAWFGRFSHVLNQFGMTRSANDHSIFYRHLKEKTIILVVYVDDLIITGDDNEGITALKKFLSVQFQITDLGKLKYFLGIEVSRSPGKILICQRKYVLDMLSACGLLGCKPVDSPMVPDTKLRPDEGEPLHDPEKYRRLVGKLNYLTVTRPDISYPVSVVSQFMSAPHTTHWDAAIRILRYLKGSPGRGLVYSDQGHSRIAAFTDADWAGCPTTRRSTTGYCVFFGGNLISWKSKKQTVVSRSSAESEYRAMANTSCELIWTKRLLSELGIRHDGLMRLHCDNESAMHIAKNQVFHERTKHIGPSQAQRASREQSYMQVGFHPKTNW